MYYLILILRKKNRKLMLMKDKGEIMYNTLIRPFYDTLGVGNLIVEMKHFF